MIFLYDPVHAVVTLSTFTACPEFSEAVDCVEP